MGIFGFGREGGGHEAPPEVTAEVGETKEEGKEYGHNVHVEVDFDRHYDPDKDEMGKSLDRLSRKGHEDKREAGANLPEGMKTKVYASEMKRAQQSAQEVAFVETEVEDIVDDKDANIINQRLTAELKKKLVDRGYDPKKLDRRSFKFLARIKKALNPLKFGAEYQKKCFIKNSEAPKEEWKKRSYNEVVQYWLDNPDETGETTNPLEAASALAYRLDTCMKMAERLYDNSNVLLKHKTHGPNPDALLREIMINEDGSVGFESVEDIGGAVTPGEGIKFVIDIDEQGKATKKLKFRDKLYDYSEQRFEELVDTYAEKNGKKKRYEKVTADSSK